MPATPSRISDDEGFALAGLRRGEHAGLRARVGYADQQYSHFGLVEPSGDGTSARLDLSLVREDGVVAFTKRFEQ